MFLRKSAGFAFSDYSCRGAGSFSWFPKRKAAQDFKVKVEFKRAVWRSLPATVSENCSVRQTAFQLWRTTVWWLCSFIQLSLICIFYCRESAIIPRENLFEYFSLAFFRQWFRPGSVFSTSVERGEYISPLCFSVPFTAPSHEAIIVLASGSTWMGFMDGSRQLEL